MRFSSAILLLPALAAADTQKPFLENLQDIAMGYYEQAKSYIPSAEIPSPIDAGASYVAAANVEKFNINNYKRKLAPSPDGPTEWMIMVTGKNESCWGGCEPANLIWNTSVPLLSVIPNGPRLGYLDCDKEAVLCSAWLAGPPTLWHFSVPQATRGASSIPAGEASGPTRLHIMHINGTTVTPQDFVKVHTEKTYLAEEEYTGVFHPIDGLVTKLGLTQPLGYVLRFFSTTPSWMIMIGISFVSRQLMSRRMTGRALATPGAPAAGAPKRD